LEVIGKELRQKDMNTVKSNHTLQDISKMKSSIYSSEILVRCNPINPGSQDEINSIIDHGADLIMLPYFKSVKEVADFLGFVKERVRTILLFETQESVKIIDYVLENFKFNEAYIGLNDLHIEYGKKFMFELLIDGTIEKLSYKFRKKGIPFGFGGVAAIGEGLLPAEYIIKEHYRLGSHSVILSRSFCDIKKIDDMNVIKKMFYEGVNKIRKLEEEAEIHYNYFYENKEQMKKIIDQVIKNI